MPEELTSNYRSARRWSRVGSVALYAVSALVVALVLARTVGGVFAHGPRAAAALVPEAVSELPLVAATVLLAEFLRHVGGTGAPFGRAQRVRLLAASLTIAAKSVLDVALPLVARWALDAAGLPTADAARPSVDPVNVVMMVFLVCLAVLIRYGAALKEDSDAFL